MTALLFLAATVTLAVGMFLLTSMVVAAVQREPSLRQEQAARLTLVRQHQAKLRRIDAIADETDAALLRLVMDERKHQDQHW